MGGKGRGRKKRGGGRSREGMKEKRGNKEGIEVKGRRKSF